MILSDFLFFDLGKTDIVSNTLYNTNGESLILQVSQTGSDAINITIEGKSDIESNTWGLLGCVENSTLSIQNDIKSTGIFTIPISGINYIRANNMGTAGEIKLYGKVIG